MKVTLVANWELDDFPNMVFEVPCIPQIGTLINLSVDCEDEYEIDSDVKKSCEDFVNSVEKITGYHSPVFFVDDVMFHTYTQVPTIYVVQQ